MPLEHHGDGGSLNRREYLILSWFSSAARSSYDSLILQATQLPPSNGMTCAQPRVALTLWFLFSLSCMVAAPRRMPLRFTAFHLGIKAPETLTALDRIFAWSVIAMGAAFGLHRSSWQAARSPAVKTIPVFFCFFLSGASMHCARPRLAPRRGPFWGGTAQGAAATCWAGAGRPRCERGYGLEAVQCWLNALCTCTYVCRHLVLNLA